jgi:hypothetical protein
MTTTYKEFLKSYNNGDLEACAKYLVRFCAMTKDKQVVTSNSRYCIFKISDKNVWKYAGFKKRDGVVQKVSLFKLEPELFNLV